MNELSEKNELHNNELKRQKGIIKNIKLLNERIKKETGKPRYFYNFVMGCQMNAHDSEKLAGMLTEMGYTETDKENKADFIVYNTCCVRENAENKVYGNLGFLKNYKKANPDVIIAIGGCMMQQDSVIETIKKSYSHVDILFGTFNLYKFPELILERIESGQTVVDIWQEHREIVEDLPHIRKSTYKASVNIMYGCNNFCTYCIVPYVRGRERSREKEDILNEIKDLSSKGVKEITLLGQNVNSYGKTLENPITFAELLREINKISGIKRIKFMTSHPKDLSDDLIQAMKECDKVLKYLHLPFQSGSTKILEKMNRGYTKEGYLSLIEKIKGEIPDILISTDIIVGFPSETEEDFLDTVDVVKSVGYSTAFTFIYSKRTGTPAALMIDENDEIIVKERFNRLLSELNPLIHKLHSSQLGKTFNVFVDGESDKDKGTMTGRTENNLLVHFKENNNDLVGEIIRVKIIDNKSFYLIGERV